VVDVMLAFCLKLAVVVVPVVVRVVGEFRRLAGSKAAPVVNQDKLVVLDLVAFLSVQLAVVAAVEYCPVLAAPKVLQAVVAAAALAEVVVGMELLVMVGQPTNQAYSLQGAELVAVVAGVQVEEPLFYL
jgi:hypothetical protein